MKRRSFLKRALAAGAGLSLANSRLVQAAQSDIAELGAEPRLLVDDWLLEHHQGLVRTVHRPTKQGLIQEADGRPWDRGDGAAVVRDRSGKFHMYYRFMWNDASVRDLHPSIGNDKAHWFRRTVGYATSEDGIRWTRPVLGLFDGPDDFRPAPRERWNDGVFEEPVGFSKNTNLGCPINHIQDLAGFGAVADPARRYLINVIYRADSHNFAPITDAGLYFAGDVPDIVRQLQWRKRLAPVWEGARRGPRGEATSVAGWSADEKAWFVCCQGSMASWMRRGGRDIARYTSPDLIHWSDEQLVLPVPGDESREATDWVEYMDLSAFRAGDVWLGMLVIFHGDRSNPLYQMPNLPGAKFDGVWRKGTTELRLLASRDAGRSWQRLGGKEPWISCHAEEHGYDRLVFAGSPVRVGDELWLYYTAWDGDHLVWNRDGTLFDKTRTRVGRVARAALRWNGYASLDASDQPGEFLTRPLRLTGDPLHVNLRAPRGQLQVEIQHTDGRPVDGFTMADCEPIVGDGVSLPVGFRGRRLRGISGQTVRLRCRLRNGSLYSLQSV